MGDKAEKVLEELEDYHKEAKEKIEEIEKKPEVKKEIKKEKAKEIKTKEEKKPRKKMGEEKEITIKIRIKPRVIERIAYITVILVLIYFAFFRNISISMPSFGREESVVITTPTGNETAETEATSEAAEEETEETTAETETTTTGKIDAELVFNNDNIGTSGNHPSVKVTSITYKIRNKGDDLYSLVDVYWYDDDDTAVIKSKVRASYKLKISAGRVATKTITSFTGGTYLNSDNRKETFVLKLYDDKTGKKLDEVTTYFTPP